MGLTVSVEEFDRRRSDVRLALGRPGTMRFQDGRAILVTIADLTRDGCRVVTDETILPDTPCRIGIANIGLTPARAVWRGPDGYGCAFTVPLAPGAITAAFEPSNVAALPIDQGFVTVPAVKWTPLARVLFGGALIVGSWGVVGGIVFAVR